MTDIKEQIKELLDKLRDEAERTDEPSRPNAFAVLEIADEIGVLVDQL